MPRLAKFALLVGLALTLPAEAQTFFGPSPYLSVADSPFDLSGLGSTAFVEDFEDSRFNAPGVHSCSGVVLYPSGATDSVDGDDGVIDGLGQNGFSYFNGGGPAVNVTFKESELGGLPTFAGIVWTDGDANCSIDFQAFDKDGNPLGSVHGDHIGDNSISGTTGEDRFCGVEFKGGIGSIIMSDSGFSIEIDHIQYGGVPPQHFPACYPDCDEDGALSLFDFLCFVNSFNAQELYANCENDGCGSGLDLFDFLCYTNAFNAGC